VVALPPELDKKAKKAFSRLIYLRSAFTAEKTQFFVPGADSAKLQAL
jgi:hypothetical protein